MIELIFLVIALLIIIVGGGWVIAYSLTEWDNLFLAIGTLFVTVALIALCAYGIVTVCDNMDKQNQSQVETTTPEHHHCPYCNEITGGDK